METLKPSADKPTAPGEWKQYTMKFGVSGNCDTPTKGRFNIRAESGDTIWGRLTHKDTHLQAQFPNGCATLFAIFNKEGVARVEEISNKSDEEVDAKEVAEDKEDELVEAEAEAEAEDIEEEKKKAKESKTEMEKIDILGYEMSYIDLGLLVVIAGIGGYLLYNKFK